MNTFGRLLAKELLEVRRTWRLPVVAGVILFFALMSPVAALLAPAIVDSVAGGQTGVVIKLPDPTYLDSHVQWIKNLSQMGLLLVVFSSAGLLAGERASGTAILIASKPVSRYQFAFAKFVGHAALLALSTLMGALLVWMGTLLAFGQSPAGPLVAMTSVWLAGAIVAIAVTLVFSAVMHSVAAGIFGLVAFSLAGIAGMWEPARHYTPAGLLTAPGEILAGQTPEVLWPLVTAALLTTCAVGLAGYLFSTREL